MWMMRGSKPGRQHDTIQTTAHLTTRLQADRHNRLDMMRRGSFYNKVAGEQNELIRNTNSTDRHDRFAAMTRRTYLTTKKAIAGKNRRRAKPDTLSPPSPGCARTHLPKESCRLTVGVTRLGWEGGFALETGFRASQKHAQKRGAYPKSGARCVSPNRVGKPSQFACRAPIRTQYAGGGAHVTRATLARALDGVRHRARYISKPH